MKTPHKIRTLVLDFDNCIVLDENGEGSEEVKDRAWFEVFPEIGRAQLLPVLEEIKHEIAGGKGDRKDIIERVLARFAPASLNPEEVAQRSDCFSRIVQEGIAHISISTPTRETLALLSRRFPLYINTATPRDAADESISALGLHSYFKAVFGRPGTKAENLRFIIHAEKIPPQGLLFVDDQQSGWEVAQEVGCRFIGIRTKRNTFWTTLQLFPILSEFSELSTLLS